MEEQIFGVLQIATETCTLRAPITANMVDHVAITLRYLIGALDAPSYLDAAAELSKRVGEVALQAARFVIENCPRPGRGA